MYADWHLQTLFDPDLARFMGVMLSHQYLKLVLKKESMVKFPFAFSTF